MKRTWLVPLVLCCGGGLLLALWAVLTALELSGTSLWLFGCGTNELKPWILSAGVLLAAAGGTGWLWCRFPRTRLLWGSLLAVAVFLLTLYGMLSFGFAAERTYYVFRSDDGEHTVIVLESDSLLSEWGTIYEQTSPLTMKRVGAIEFYGAMPRGEYEIIWLDGYFEICYFSDGQKIEYAK